MVNFPQGTFDFPGVLSPIKGKYHCAHGTSPGRIVLTAASQGSPVLNVGDLRISYGSQYFDVRDCKVVEQINFYDTNGGWQSEYLLEDRRWRWQFGEIEGHYNRKLASGKINTDCERTPHELAELLFRAMKEQRYDYSRMPNEARPEVEWVGANPAQELQRLADILGCRLVYDPVSDLVSVERTGEGAPLPNLPSVDQSGGNLTKPPIPSGVRVVGQQTRVQMALELELVVEDTDGEFRKPEDLSYVSSLASATGKQESNWFEDLSPDFENITDLTHLKLLKKTMWRYFRPKLDGDAEYKLSQYLVGQGANVQYIKPENVSLTLNREYFEKVDGEKFAEKSKRGFMLGVYRVIDRGEDAFGVGLGEHENTSATRGDVKYDGSVSIDNNGDDPLIIFGDQIWKWNEEKKVIPDEIYLVCTFLVRNEDQDQTCSLHHFNYFHQITSDPKVGPEIVFEESLLLKPYLRFDEETLESQDPFLDNRFDDKLIERARTVVENRARKWGVFDAGNANYQELVLARLDGAIQSVVWSFGDRGATTQIYRNSEPDFLETKYDRRVTDAEIARKAKVTQP